VAPASVNFFLDGFGFVFTHAFLDRLGCAVDQVLGFFQAEAGDFTNGFDDVDLVGADRP
jgi:hypothetical protein